MTAPVAGAVRGRPSYARLNARVEAAVARAERASVELAARKQEASALSGAMRTIAQGMEAYALDHRGDMRQMQWIERLRGAADQVDRRWEAS